MKQIGILSNTNGLLSFRYLPEWHNDPSSFSIDPDLKLGAGEFHPSPKVGGFGMLLDSIPDRWGQTLMYRRASQQAAEDKEKDLGDGTIQPLTQWDFLLGVQDATRQGALRFKFEGSDIFLGDEDLPAPPIADLPELEEIAIELSSKRIDDLDKLKRWLAVLVAPGSSLGGMRPKANFTDSDGSLWIAKFPAKDDTRDEAAWEMLTHDMASRAGIDVPEARLLKFGSEYHTFCVKRFDREEDRRIFYASAMTMLRTSTSEGFGYLHMAKVIRDNGDPKYIKQDLEELFRRVLFNTIVNNCDDHLRNHGFILNKNGWRLSKAFDVNPVFIRTHHELYLDDKGSKFPSTVEPILDTAHYYGVTHQHACEILSRIANAVSDWENKAKLAGIALADIQTTGSAFMDVSQYTNLESGTKGRPDNFGAK